MVVIALLPSESVATVRRAVSATRLRCVHGLRSLIDCALRVAPEARVVVDPCLCQPREFSYALAKFSGLVHSVTLLSPPTERFWRAYRIALAHMPITAFTLPCVRHTAIYRSLQGGADPKAWLTYYLASTVEQLPLPLSAALYRLWVEANPPHSSLALARQAGVHRTTLNRQLHSVGFLSASALLAVVKTANACGLLSSGDLSVGRIAKLPGFGSRTTCIRTFQRLFSVSPSAAARWPACKLGACLAQACVDQNVASRQPPAHGRTRWPAQ